MDSIQIIFMLLGGLGLFLFGIKQMEDGLKQLAGGYLKQLMKALAKNKVLALLVGLIVTTLMQSSSATTVMIVGFINAGFINLLQAMGFILGANIGSTTTGQIMSFELDQYALPILGIGMILYMFCAKERIKNLGLSLLGFGMLFYGMVVMKQAIEPLHESGVIEQWFTVCNAHSIWSMLVALLIATAATAIVQSSGATVGIIIALAATGVIKDIGNAIPLILGCNIGTCITALLASMRTNIAARKAAVAHAMFNVVGAVVILATFPLWTWLVPIVSENMSRQVANAHTLFKIVECMVFLPFIPLVVKCLDKLWPDKIETTVDLLQYRTFNKSEYLSKKWLTTPEVALIQIHKEIGVMIRIAVKMIKCVRYGLMEHREDKIVKIPKYEDIMDNIKKDIHDYAILLSRKKLNNQQSCEVAVILEGASAMERVADHVESMAKFIRLAEEGVMILDDNNKAHISGVLNQAIDLALLVEECSQGYSVSVVRKIVRLGKQIDKDLKEVRDYYTYCLRTGSWNLSSDLSLMELITAIEKFCGHCRGFVSKYMKQLQQLKKEPFVEVSKYGTDNDRKTAT